MTRMRKRLIEDFIIPALNDERYGNKLCWTNKEFQIFRLFWSHKNAAKWSSEDTIVFQDWDRLKGHYKPEGKNYFMCSKQRFRAALYKLNKYVKSLKTGDKYYREYQLTLDEDKGQGENLVRSKKSVPKRIHQSSIPTSVIRKNTSYAAKPALNDQKSMSPPTGFFASDDQILSQYSHSMEKLNQLRISRQYENRSREENLQKSPRDIYETSVLRENSSTPRIPHVAPQLVPVFSAYKQFHTHRHHNFHESPSVFVSKIYAGPENVPQMKDDALSSSYSTDEEKSSGILNLSVKSDTSSNAPSR